jgi:hypothetical protein
MNNRVFERIEPIDSRAARRTHSVSRSVKHNLAEAGAVFRAGCEFDGSVAVGFAPMPSSPKHPDEHGQKHHVPDNQSCHLRRIHHPFLEALPQTLGGHREFIAIDIDGSDPGQAPVSRQRMAIA